MEARSKAILEDNVTEYRYLNIIQDTILRKDNQNWLRGMSIHAEVAGQTASHGELYKTLKKICWKDHPYHSKGQG